ncbi:DUF551 domain-containing protein [Hafnia alvei]|uniref:DUF551 domain-containing protein n=1 Tax=Hafnia alvei TaxID=569 RepID=UPI00345C648F
MNKLTTDRLEKFVSDIKTDGMCDVTDHQVALALRQLLAYEQAAKNPVAWVAADSEGFPEYNGHNEFSADCGAGTPLYAAPVLPKQPELVDLSQQVEILNRILNWILKELPVPTQKATVMAIRLSSVIGIISDLEVSAPAQPVIPEQNDLSEKLIGLANHIASAANGIPFGWQDWADEIVTDLRSLASTTQPVSEPYKLPVIPDGWVACSDRMPEPKRWLALYGARVFTHGDKSWQPYEELCVDQGYLGCDGKFYLLNWDYPGILGDNYNNDLAVATHWMYWELPEPPMQEIE